MNHGHIAHMERYEGRSPRRVFKPALKGVTLPQTIGVPAIESSTETSQRVSPSYRPQSHYEGSLQAAGIATNGLASKTIRATLEGVQAAQQAQCAEVPHTVRNMLLQGGAHADSYCAALAIGVRHYAVPEGFAQSSE